MEYLDLCWMREVGYTSTKLHFTNSWVRKSLKCTRLSVYVRDAWSLSRGLCFQVRNSRIHCSSAGGYQTALHCCGAPFWIGGELPVFVVRPHAPNREARTVTVRYEYMHHATPNIYIYIYCIKKKYEVLNINYIQLWFLTKYVSNIFRFMKSCYSLCIIQ